MRTIFSVIPKIDNSCNNDFSVEVLVNDGALMCLSARDLKQAFCRVRGEHNEIIPIHIKFVVDCKHDYLEYNSFFRKLEEATAGELDVDICTSGENFNSIMTCLGVRNNMCNYRLYVDDHNIKDNLKKIDLSRASCDCYLSKRYIRNLDDAQFKKVYNLPRYRFDRKEAVAERRVIRNIWKKIVPSFESLDEIKPVTKIALVSDYISQNIELVNDNEHCFDNVLDVYVSKKGTDIGVMSLASLLLDNFFAKTDCRVVEEVSSKKNSGKWLATSNNKGNYVGFGLSVFRGISDFIKNSTRTGKISLEKEHKDREDCDVIIHSFEDVLSSKYINAKNRLTKCFHSLTSRVDDKDNTSKQYKKY